MPAASSDLSGDAVDPASGKLLGVSDVLVSRVQYFVPFDQLSRGCGLVFTVCILSQL